MWQQVFFYSSLCTIISYKFCITMTQFGFFFFALISILEAFNIIESFNYYWMEFCMLYNNNTLLEKWVSVGKNRLKQKNDFFFCCKNNFFKVFFVHWKRFFCDCITKSDRKIRPFRPLLREVECVKKFLCTAENV